MSFVCVCLFVICLDSSVLDAFNLTLYSLCSLFSDHCLSSYATIVLILISVSLSGYKDGLHISTLSHCHAT